MNRDKQKLATAINKSKVPIVTLDNKWHKIFSMVEKPEEIEADEKLLIDLLKKQGKLNTDIKEIKKLKKKLMDEIVELMNSGNSSDAIKTEKNKELVEECNSKLALFQDELMDIPSSINEVNKRLMLNTMDICYDLMHDNEEEISELAEWIKNIRIELKKNVVRKQEMEIQNAIIYTYMHDVFGQEAMDIFDITTNPLEKIAALKESKDNNTSSAKDGGKS